MQAELYRLYGGDLQLLQGKNRPGRVSSLVDIYSRWMKSFPAVYFQLFPFAKRFLQMELLIVLQIIFRQALQASIAFIFQFSACCYIALH